MYTAGRYVSLGGFAYTGCNKDTLRNGLIHLHGHFDWLR